MRVTGISPEDFELLQRAADALEHPSLAARMSNVLGTPLEEGFKLLPPSWYQKLTQTTEAVLHRTLEAAISTLPEVLEKPHVDQHHRNLGFVTGAMGGFFGLPGTLIELPFATMLMLRSIAAIAAREGEDLTSMDARMSCMEVFALGGPSKSDDAAETGYYGLRMLMAYHLSIVSQAVAEKGIAVRQLPAAVAVVRTIAARFGVSISEKAAMSAVPLIGAASGALVNTIFMDHYERIAHGHFIVRRLERTYGQDVIRNAYESIVSPEDAAARTGVEVIEGEIVRETIAPGKAEAETAAEPVTVDRHLRSFQRSLDIKASQQHVFDIIANVPGYPDFVESCVDARTTWQSGNELHTELTLHEGKSDESYAMLMNLEPPQRIVMKFVTEPPRKLQVEWLVTPIDEDESRLDVTVFYKAENFAKEIVLRPMLRRVYMQIANAVAAEAERS